MSDFVKRFLLEDLRRFSPSGRYVALAAFGKHPGWDDHVEDLGLETESLNLAKTVLYVNGIGGQIDSGAWEKSDPSQQLPQFRHLFVWHRSGQILIGRLWSSSDGKGRKRYPMVVCAHFAGVSLASALKLALPALGELEQRCLQTSSAADVRSVLAQQRATLREAIQARSGGTEFAPVSAEVLRRTLNAADDVRREGFLRVLYQMKGQFGAFAIGTFNPRASFSDIRPQQIRVPAIAEDPEQTLLFWSRFFLAYVETSVPILLSLPLEQSWLDVTAGEPGSHEFFCLRASPKAVPLVSEVPYQLDDTFRAKAAAFLEAFQSGKTPSPNLQSAPDPVAPAGSEARAKGGWLKWLGVGLVVVLGAVAAMMFLRKGDQPSPISQTPVAKITPANSVPSSDVKSSQSPPSSSPSVKIPGKSPADAQAEAVRLAEEKRQADAMAAAAKLKADAEDAARERAAAETARLAKEKEAALQKEQQERERMAAEVAAAKKKFEQPAEPKSLVVASAAGPVDAKPSSSAPMPSASAGNEMTNSIGMILVALPSGILAGKFEVTQAEYKRVMGANPSKSLNDRQPVERVSWNDAVEFTRRLTSLERDQLPAGKAYTLPTEQQWKDFLGGQKFEDLPGRGVTGRSEPLPVGQAAPPNRFGLFDVLGNVWEWCLDGATGDEKLLKGGAFNSANYDRTLLPDRQVSNCGFRCVLAAH